MYLHMASRLNYKPHAKTMQHAKTMLQAASRQLNQPMFGYLVRLRQVPVHRHCAIVFINALVVLENQFLACLRNLLKSIPQCG